MAAEWRASYVAITAIWLCALPLCGAISCATPYSASAAADRRLARLGQPEAREQCALWLLLHAIFQRQGAGQAACTAIGPARGVQSGAGGLQGAPPA
mmetsp:Transcript_3724/g.9377  ORF Transcript_3724/g.9377 Transcript_3724/m.9377 type:complete len:97 (-) Transcript_3724:330-620(-)